ncbi:hypothetical protein PHJA_000073400 [Phtheirospermum japonicum]|uniref:Uncharacterized protein n=1 Tax=Phtheirospermum japonicum TaxID=374723 RepID=A0A830B1U2_9LAMI|nr:hypothetical protein PHJA_000073400 [Phtheirospermum japonicum]
MASDEKGEDQIKAVGFAAGMAACMACIQRAIVVSVLVHWRVWAFLALNLLLLAILFISKFQTIPIDRECCGGDSDFKKREKRRKRISMDGGEKVKLLPKSDVDPVTDEMKNEGDDIKKDDYDELSEEELNRRVEAFIAMFRQHLASDAKGKSCGYMTTSNQVKSPQRLSFSHSNKYI